MNNKLSFRKTPLALAVAGLVFSMSAAQADSAFNWGRWAYEGSTGPGAACTEGIGAGACNQDETNVQRDLVAGEGPVVPPVVPPEEVPDGQWTIYASKFEIEDGAEPTGETGTGTLLVPPAAAIDGDEGDLEVTLAGSYNGNFTTVGDGDAFYPNDPNVVPFLALSLNEGGEGFILTTEDPEDDDSLDFVPNFDDANGQYADGLLGFDFFSFLTLFDGFGEGGEGGAFFAGQPTLLTDMASLQAGNISANYGGFAPDTGHDVAFVVDFGPATFHADFTGRTQFGVFDADGVINGADFSATGPDQLGGAAFDGFVEGTFFSGDGTSGPDALGGRFEVIGGEDNSAASAFGAVRDQEPGGTTTQAVVNDLLGDL